MLPIIGMRHELARKGEGAVTSEEDWQLVEAFILETLEMVRKLSLLFVLLSRNQIGKTYSPW